jgi:hypothetical protein
VLAAGVLVLTGAPAPGQQFVRLRVTDDFAHQFTNLVYGVKSRLGAAKALAALRFQGVA